MPKTFLSLIYILISMLSIQFGASVAKKIFHIAGPAGTSMLRVNLAALILFIIWKPWRKSHLKTLTRKKMLTFFYYGVSLGGMNLFFYIALERIPLGIAVALEFTGPLALAFLSSKKWTDLLWAILAGLGIWFILPVSNSVGSLDPWGIFFAVLAGVFWAFYIIFGKASGKEVHSGYATAWGMLFAGLVIIPFGIGMNSKEIFMPGFFSSLLPLGLMIAVLSSALPYSLEMMAMKNIPSKTFGILMSMEPAIASLMGFLFLRERLMPMQIMGIGCIIAASAGTTLSINRNEKIPPVLNS
jgi:inner membrane transporter RhtA